MMKGAVTPSFPEAERLAIVGLFTALRQMQNIESYREMIEFIGPKDPTPRQLLESIPAQEEEHTEDLVDLLEDLPKD
jgi:ferritin-like protein